MSEWIIEVLSRPPLRIDDNADPAALEMELRERLEALLASHMLEPTADGWRDLALTLALEHDPLFSIETPVDRSSLGGRPPGLSAFILRSVMTQEIRAQEASGPRRGAQARAAKKVAAKMGVSPGTAANAMSRKPTPSDNARRAPYLRKAEAALKAAANRLSSQL
jgi:hypothetical protein